MASSVDFKGVNTLNRCYIYSCHIYVSSVSSSLSIWGRWSYLL